MNTKTPDTEAQIADLALLIKPCPCIAHAVCDYCGGITSPHSTECELCKGTGEVPAHPELRVEIPAETIDHPDIPAFVVAKTHRPVTPEETEAVLGKLLERSESEVHRSFSGKGKWCSTPFGKGKAFYGDTPTAAVIAALHSAREEKP